MLEALFKDVFILGNFRLQHSLLKSVIIKIKSELIFIRD